MSIVVPAHNEAPVIGRCLKSLTDGSEPGEFEIVVVCNGCSDSTAAQARATAPHATVVEVASASKSEALNTGDDHATVFPRAYIDADVVVPVSSLRALRQALLRVPCAAPRPSFVTEGRPWLIRRFYRAWERLPYLRDRMVGSGVYAMSAEGRCRFGKFPKITADDQFVMQSFHYDEREALAGHAFLVETPRTARDLLRIRTRVYRGNRELTTSALAAYRPSGGATMAVLRECSSRSGAVDMATYASVNMLAKLRAVRAATQWERDESTRRASRPAGEDSTSPLKVAYIVSRYPSPSHSFVRQEVEELRSLGLDIKTFTVRPSDQLAQLSADDQREAASTTAILPVPVRDLIFDHVRAAIKSPPGYVATLVQAMTQSPPGAKATLWRLFYFAEAIALWAKCQDAGYRHIHAHFANVGADLAWLASSFGARAEPDASWKWSFTMHGPTEFFSVERFNLKRKVEAAEKVICISKYCRSQLMMHTGEEHWGKFAVAHCGVDLNRFACSSQNQPGSTHLKIVCVGRLVPEKGQSLLIEAVAEMNRLGIPGMLTLAGDGPQRVRLEKQARGAGLAGHVNFVGTIAHDRVPALLRENDVFCLPSFAEGIPVVLMEAMACGLPTISTNVAGIPELIRHRESGLLVEPGRVDLLVDALAALAADPDLRTALGGRGRERVASEFEASRCARDVAAVLEAAIAGDSPQQGTVVRHAS